jgi:hypothetical protein
MSPLAALVAGIGILVAGTLAGWDAGIVDAIATPPALIRAGLAGLAVVFGLWLLSGAIERLGASEPTETGERDLVALARGVRLAFLALAAFAAAGGWVLGHPLPIVVALVIAGVDIVETSFLLAVMAVRRT